MVNISTLKLRDNTGTAYNYTSTSALTFKCLLLDFLPFVLAQLREAGGLEPQVMHLEIKQSYHTIQPRTYILPYYRGGGGRYKNLG